MFWSGWRTARSIAMVVRREPHLVGLSLAGAAIWAALFAGLLYLLGGEGLEVSWRIPVALLIAAVPAILARSVVLAAAIKRLQGDSATIYDSVGLVVGRLPLLIGWYILASGAGFVLTLLQRRMPQGGRMSVATHGLRWSVAHSFAVPVVLYDDRNPIPALSRSASLVKRRWSGTAAAFTSLSLVKMLLAVPLLALPTLAGWSIGSTVAGFYIGLVLLLAGLGAFDVIATGALYLYAADGRAPLGFDEASLHRSFLSLASDSADAHRQVPGVDPDQDGLQLLGVSILGGMAVAGLMSVAFGDGTATTASIPLVAVSALALIAVLGGAVAATLRRRVGVPVALVGGAIAATIAFAEIATGQAKPATLIELLGFALVVVATGTYMARTYEEPIWEPT